MIRLYYSLIGGIPRAGLILQTHPINPLHLISKIRVQTGTQAHPINPDSDKSQLLRHSNFKPAVSKLEGVRGIDIIGWGGGMHIDVLLRVPLGDREPRALDLQHQPMARQQGMANVI